MFSRPGNNMDIFTDILIGSIVRAEIRYDSVILSTKDNLVGGCKKPTIEVGTVLILMVNING